MIEHIVLFKLVPGSSAATVEWMMRETRLRLLKIPVVLAVRCGYNLDPVSDWAFFLTVTLDSADRIPTYMNDPVHLRFVEEVIRPNTRERLALDFETTPGTDPLYT